MEVLRNMSLSIKLRKFETISLDYPEVVLFSDITSSTKSF